MALGPELVLNGDFETDDPTEGIVPTNWTQVTATGTFLTGKPSDMVARATATGAEGGVGRQDVTTLSIGKTYRFIVTAVEASTGDTQFQVEVGSTTGGADYLDFTSAGVGGNDAQQPTVNFVATTNLASITLSHIGVDEATICVFDDASIKEVDFELSAPSGGEPGNVGFFEGKAGRKPRKRKRRRELVDPPSKAARSYAGALAPDDTTFDQDPAPAPTAPDTAEEATTDETLTLKEMADKLDKMNAKLLYKLLT